MNVCPSVRANDKDSKSLDILMKLRIRVTWYSELQKQLNQNLLGAITKPQIMIQICNLEQCIEVGRGICGIMFFLNRFGPAL